MIAVTDLHGKHEYVNAELIERVQSTPDTQIVLTNGHRIYVTESPEEIAERVIAYRGRCLRAPPPGEPATEPQLGAKA